MANASFGMCGRVVVFVMVGEPSAEEDRAFDAFLREQLLQRALSFYLVLDYADKPPSTKRRAQLARLLGGPQPPRIAVLTSSAPAIAILVTTAMNFLTGGRVSSRLFRLHQLDEALDFFELSHEERAQVKMAIIEHKVRLGLRAQ